jgi:hypothetical protein
MIETNMRIVRHGTDLYLDVRRVQITPSDSATDLPEKACRQLRAQCGLPAAPDLSQSVPQLLVISGTPLEDMALEGTDWRTELHDAGHARLRFREPSHRELIARLYERSAQLHLSRQSTMWTLDSPRIWYEAEPFQVAGGIAAYRRYHLSAVPVDGVGLGVAVHLSTAFFTVDTVADFFDESLPPEERQRRLRCFDALTLRQRGHKGTLLYDLRKTHHKCYFVEFLSETTCSTSGSLRINGATFPSLYDYYCDKRPYARVGAEDAVAVVSFHGVDRPVQVAANRLRVRVPNSALPRQLSQVDKIAPQQRASLIERFWRTMGGSVLGDALSSQSWQPPGDKVLELQLPGLLLGQGAELPAPASASVDSCRAHFQARLSMLNQHGCYHVPPQVTRSIVMAYPSCLDSAVAQEFARGLTQRLSKWTRKDIRPEMLPFQSVSEAISQLDSRLPGVLVFVFDAGEPETYYLLSVRLKNWRIKRVTTTELQDRFKSRSFIDVNALDVLQQLDCVPWSLATPLAYGAQLAVDVGVDRRYFALTLLVCRPQRYMPPFWMHTVTCPKADHRSDNIERGILRDQIVSLFEQLPSRRFDPIEALLVLRDGREGGEEIAAIRDAASQLEQRGVLSRGASVHVIDFAKRSLKGLRMWARAEGRITNVREGTALLLDGQTVVLASTGAAALGGGTAVPVVLTAADGATDMVAVAGDVFATAQMNWSSPSVAQRLPLPLQRTDQALDTRAAQEIRGLR